MYCRKDIGSPLFYLDLTEFELVQQDKLRGRCNAVRPAGGNLVTAYVFPSGQTTHSHSGPSLKSQSISVSVGEVDRDDTSLKCELYNCFALAKRITVGYHFFLPKGNSVGIDQV